MKNSLEVCQIENATFFLTTQYTDYVLQKHKIVYSNC